MNSTERKGYWGEFIAFLLLKIRGYRILSRRYKTTCGEIDIIAQKENTIVFVEVKARKTIEKCYNAIADKQLKRMQMASEIFLSKNKDLRQNYMRYDVIFVADWKLPIHIKNVSI